MNKEWTIDIFTRNLKYYMKKFDKTQKENGIFSWSICTHFPRLA